MAFSKMSLMLSTEAQLDFMNDWNFWTNPMDEGLILNPADDIASCKGFFIASTTCLF